MPELWIVMNIGCIECGVSSELVGLYDSEQAADIVAIRLNGTHSWRQGGQNSFEVFPLGDIDETKQEYLEDVRP